MSDKTGYMASNPKELEFPEDTNSYNDYSALEIDLDALEQHMYKQTENIKEP